jgi:hypothetical protein
MEHQRDTKKTLHCISGLLRKHRVPFVISGGFSAKIYGSPRPLNDIDMDIPARYFDTILEDIRPYIIYGPDQYVDERWDLQLITLNHEGQEVDISGGDTVHICDARTGEWADVPADFENVEHKEVLGIVVPVVRPEDLISYKSMLAGDHQQIDIDAARRYMERRSEVRQEV